MVYWDNLGVLDPNTNYYGLGDWSVVNPTLLFVGTLPRATISVADAFAIDTKLDNGIPATGNVYGYAAADAWSQNGTCYSAGKYNTAVSNDVCMVVVKILAQTSGSY